MVHYLGMQIGKDIESSIVDVKEDGTLQNVFIEERYNRKKYSGILPFNGLSKACFGRSENDKLRISKNYEKELDNFGGLFNNIKFVKTQNELHHLCHAYESFYTSGFNRAAILVIDGYGDNNRFDVKEKESITFYHKIGKETRELKKYFLPYSLGKFYSFASGVCGFNSNEEGHFMGLSSYGKPFEDRIIGIKRGEFQYYCDEYELRKQYEVSKNNFNLINNINYAATVQRDLNECVLELVKDIKNMTNEDNLCITGGVFNNVITNNLVCESGIFKNVWCSPAPGDFGLSIGRAYIAYEADAKDLLFQKLDNAYKGESNEYNDDNIVNYLNSNNIKYVEINNNNIIDLLTSGKVLSWFQGASEFGRRALGHRSLIANPEYPHMYEKLSGKIKKRAPYRPLACTVPDELFDLMFDVKNKDLTEYMLRSIPIRREMREKVFACTHIDGTTRPQRLRREVNPEFYDMIMEFYKKTGIPCVINTSLNGGGEPMVESLEDLFEFNIKHAEVEGTILNGKFYVDNSEYILCLTNIK